MSQKMPCKTSLNINAHLPSPFQTESLKLFTWTSRAELWFQFQMWNKQKSLRIWKQSVILCHKTSQLFLFHKIWILCLHKGTLSHRAGTWLIECEHSEPQHITNLAISYCHFLLHGSRKHAAGSNSSCLRLTMYLIIAHQRGQFCSLDHSIN